MRVADLKDAYCRGQSLLRSFSKNPSQTTGAGIWFDLSMSPGNPVPQYYFSAPLEAAALSYAINGGLDHGPAQPGYQKYLANLTLNTASATALGGLEILDYLMYYPGIAMDVDIVPLTTGIPLPRQVAGFEGRGVQIMAIEQNPYASTPAATFRVTYTNQDGVAGRVTPLVTCNSQLVTGTVATSALATAGCAGRFIPLASGDSGVRLIESIEFTAGDVGLLVLVLVNVVARVTLYENTASTEIDFMQEFGYLPRITDDAYLNFIIKPLGTLAAQSITGEITTVWSNT